MQIEYEATFTDINKEEVRKKLKKVEARLVRPEFLQKRITFNLPKGYSAPDRWVRVREEYDKVTMSLKIVDGKKIENQKEICFEVGDLKRAEEFLAILGCQRKSYQENKREIWQADKVEITIDEWPFLEPFVEIEGRSEREVKAVAVKPGFDYGKARFCSITTLYAEKYNLSEDFINNKVPKIIFEMENPFL